eukprot:Unigene2993_Nuclearia_a/m.9208 Unigene2993_Nuclearia_a/g.9208  ORF Unigene2993_Nuclearia_a/g.9208 Unigene2993_Nuclearia_a/m.9208 type:complete len:327 (+) Unigene2993_Nuclearia_a:886-1866(+)
MTMLSALISIASSPRIVMASSASSAGGTTIAQPVLLRISWMLAPLWPITKRCSFLLTLRLSDLVVRFFSAYSSWMAATASATSRRLPLTTISFGFFSVPKRILTADVSCSWCRLSVFWRKTWYILSITSVSVVMLVRSLTMLKISKRAACTAAASPDTRISVLSSSVFGIMMRAFVLADISWRILPPWPMRNRWYSLGTVTLTSVCLSRRCDTRCLAVSTSSWRPWMSTLRLPSRVSCESIAVLVWPMMYLSVSARLARAVGTISRAGSTMRAVNSSDTLGTALAAALPALGLAPAAAAGAALIAGRHVGVTTGWLGGGRDGNMSE